MRAETPRVSARQLNWPLMFAPIAEAQVLLTGGTGFVGGTVLRELREHRCDSVVALDTTRVEDLFGFKAETSFEAGLRRPVDWYLANRGEVEARSK
jgi:nucleoside-diphosphate-sugar epimerase